MAPIEPKQIWLTNEQSKKLVHQWRSEEQAIMVGKKTVEIDNPELTVRSVEGKNPARVVIDRTLSIPSSKKIFDPNASIYLFNEIEQYDDSKIHFEKIDFSEPVLPQVLKSLFAKNIQSIIVEGGPHTFNQFIEQNLWDEARVFTAPVILEGGKPSPKLKGRLLNEEKLEGDKVKVILNL